eukprot:Sspe_Gene.93493::Locus_66119_Transcript_2_2_Confidence_0.667_Length_1684::g.93493::m.93493
MGEGEEAPREASTAPGVSPPPAWQDPAFFDESWGDEESEESNEDIEELLRRIDDPDEDHRQPCSRKIHALFDAEGAVEEAYASIHPYQSSGINIFTMTAVAVSCTTFAVETLPKYYKRDLEAFFIVESICIAWFTIELVIRFATCRDRCSFFKSKFNWIDLLSVIPYYINIFLVAASKDAGAPDYVIMLRVVRLTRVLRILKLTKNNETMTVVFEAVAKSTDAFTLLAFLVTLATVLGGSVVFFAEQSEMKFNEDTREWWYTNGRNESSEFRSIPACFWWTITTITTVGYGDMSPKTTAGKFVGVVVMFSGLVVLALPIIILGSNFQAAYDSLVKRRELRQRRLQERKEREEREREEQREAAKREKEAQGSRLALHKEHSRDSIVRYGDSLLSQSAPSRSQSGLENGSGNAKVDDGVRSAEKRRRSISPSPRGKGRGDALRMMQMQIEGIETAVQGIEQMLATILNCELPHPGSSKQGGNAALQPTSLLAPPPTSAPYPETQ